MKFIILTLLAITTTVMAFPQSRHDVFVRQDGLVDAQKPAMTDKQGNVVPFDTKGVNLANTDAGIE
ncbi:hypothetical protein E4U55_004577 [Claviceps digitariae]|nr:hypothetical protein E4U55_004577 [Claviceps digitariae]